MSFVLDLTIAIPVKNEEKNLSSCLKAIGKNFAQQVVVVDSGSTDRTREIAEQFGAEIVDFRWNGKFPKKRNWFLRNYSLSTKWVLFLDADEYLTEDFKAELREKIKVENTVGYWLSYSVYFLGKRLKGGYPMKKLALFQVGAGEYERINEDMWTEMDMEIHEHPLLKGKVGHIKSKIDHRDFRGVSHYVQKHNEYSDWEARRFLKLKPEKKNSLKWTWKQKLKYSQIQRAWMSPIYFLGSFFYYGGIRDGARGFAFAILKMSYFTQVYCKIKEDEKNQNVKNS